MVKVKLKRKGARVLGEYQAGKLKTPSGKKVTDRKQAIAIAFSEQRASDKKRKGS